MSPASSFSSAFRSPSSCHLVRCCCYNSTIFSAFVHVFFSFRYELNWIIVPCTISFPFFFLETIWEQLRISERGRNTICCRPVLLWEATLDLTTVEGFSFFPVQGQFRVFIANKTPIRSRGYPEPTIYFSLSAIDWFSQYIRFKHPYNDLSLEWNCNK